MQQHITPILESVRMMINMLFLILLIFSMTDFKIKKKKAILILALITTASMIINVSYILLRGSENFGTVCLLTTTLPFLIIMIVLSKDSLSKIFYNFWFNVNVFCLIWMIEAFLYTFLRIDLLTDILVRVALYLLFLFAALKFVRKPFRVFADTVKTNWLIIGLIPMLLTCVFFQSRPLYSSNEQSPRALFQGTIIVLLMFFTHYVIIKTCRVLYDSMLKTQMEQTMKEQIALQKEQYSSILQKIETDKLFRHDMRHHAQMLSSLLESGDIDRAKAYLSSTFQKVERNAVLTYCKNPIINSVLSHHLATAGKLKVDCKVSIPETLSLDEISLCVILSNLLENAVQNASSYLNIHIMQTGGQLCVNIKNDYCGARKKDQNGDYQTTTAGGSGLGLKSIAALVAQGDGILKITDDGTTFSVSVAIKSQ